MQWYQHSTDSHDDPDISDAMDKFGDAGYSFFFIILELYGQEFNQLDSDGWWSVSQTFVRRKLRKSWTKVEQMLNFYQTKNRILSEIGSNSVKIKIPLFLEKSSNWTKRERAKKERVPTEAPTEAPLAKEEEKEEKKKTIEEKENKDIPQKPKQKPDHRLEDFNTFYQSYPRHIGRGQAEKTWIALINKKELPDIETLLTAIQNIDNSEPKYTKHPSTWLNAKGWLDEPDPKQRAKGDRAMDGTNENMRKMEEAERRARDDSR